MNSKLFWRDDEEELSDHPVATQQTKTQTRRADYPDLLGSLLGNRRFPTQKIIFGWARGAFAPPGTIRNHPRNSRSCFGFCHFALRLITAAIRDAGSVRGVRAFLSFKR